MIEASIILYKASELNGNPSGKAYHDYANFCGAKYNPKTAENFMNYEEFIRFSDNKGWVYLKDGTRVFDFTEKRTLETFKYDGITWIKVFVYYNKPFLNKEDVQLDGKELPQEGWMRLDEFEQNDEISFFYKTTEEIIANNEL